MLIGSSVLIWGLLIQNIAYALAMPMFLGLYLATSPMVSPSLSNLIPDPAEALGIPFSVSLGMVLPSILSSLPAPAVISYDSKQLVMSLAQVFPVLTSLLQQFFKRAVKSLMPSTRPSKQFHFWILRAIYSFAFLIASVVRISVFALSITSVLFPTAFTPKHVESLAPCNVFLPAAITPRQKVSSIGSGLLLLLQYDELVGSGSVLLWAALLCAGTWNRHKLVNFHWLPLLAGASFLVLLAGPIGCAVALIWIRDELVIQRSEYSKEGDEDRDLINISQIKVLAQRALLLERRPEVLVFGASLARRIGLAAKTYLKFGYMYINEV